MQRLKKIISELHPELDLTPATRLIEDGILDSLDLVTLVTDINDAYKINIDAEDITPKNFDTIGAMLALIEKRGGEICS